MFCSKCGTQVDDNVTTCPSCGNTVAATAGESPVQPSVTPAATMPAAQPVMSATDDKTWGMLCHLLGLLTWIIGPLIIYVTKAKESAFVMDQAKESLNFQITQFIARIAAAVILILPGVRLLFPLVSAAITIAVIIFCVMGCVAANKGESYRYPFSIKFIS